MLSLGIDLGTSGVRTAVMEGHRLIASAQAAHLVQPPGEIDASKWWEAVTTCLHRQVTALREINRDPKEIAGIAVDGTSGSMVLTDADLNPVSQALMYNSAGFDAEAARIGQQVSAPHITLGSNSALARAMRLVSLAERKPAHLLHQADYITAKLLGFGGVSDDNNTLKTGFDPQQERWPDWIANLIAPHLLPKVHRPGTPLGLIDPLVAKTLDLPGSATVHAGTTDSIAAFIAAAPQKEGVAVTSLGSTVAVKLLTRARVDDPSIGLYSHRIGDMWLVGGASNTGGAVLKMFFSAEELAQLSAQIKPDEPTGIQYYPLTGPGERFPVNDPTLQPHMTPRPESDVIFLQALFENMARIEATCYREIEARGAIFPEALFTAGGGARNAAWTQIRARQLGITPSPSRYTEAAIGAAMLVG
ncbi:MAG: FGGY-family carbohydrate kinase [Pseudomonadota bacterium]